MVIKTIISKTTTVYKGLCTPARIKFILTIIGAITTIITCFASFSETKYQAVCNNILPTTIVSGIFIWILNALCKGGAGIISWILVIGPLFVMLVAIFFGKPKEEFGFLGSATSFVKKAAAAKKAAEEEDKDEDGVEARARAIVKARQELPKKIKEMQNKAIVIAKKVGGNKALKAKIQLGIDKKIESLKKNLLNYEAKIRAKGDWEEVLERVKAIQDEAKAKAAKSNIKKSKELIELENKLAKVEEDIANKTKRCIKKSISWKIRLMQLKLKRKIKEEVAEIKAENPDFS